MSGRYGLEIRAAVEGDAQGVSDLLAEAGVVASVSAVAERLAAVRRQSGAALIASEWGPPSGLIVLHWGWTLDAAQPVAWVSTLLVAVEARRRGVGRLLLKSASQAARTAGCGVLRLTTPPDAPGLAAFCQATGFTVVGETFARPLRKRS